MIVDLRHQTFCRKKLLISRVYYNQVERKTVLWNFLQMLKIKAGKGLDRKYT